MSSRGRFHEGLGETYATHRKRCAGWIVAVGATALRLTLALASVALLCDPDIAHGGDLENHLQLHIGEQTLLSANEVESFSEGTKGVVDVRLTPDARNFLLVGLREGHTSLLLLYRDGTERQVSIEVVDPQARPRRDDEEDPHVVARDNVRLEVYFVQVSDEYSHQLGMSWPTSFGANIDLQSALNLQTGEALSATATVTGQLLPQLDMAQSTGWAKVVHKTAVMTRNGREAVFGGGGELNIPVQGGLGGSLQQVRYGSAIRVLPRYDRATGRLELEVKAEVSDLSSDQGTGVPGRRTSQLETVINLGLGEAVILAGLDSMSSRRSRSGLPGLSQIPILGMLFGGHGRSEEQVKNLLCVVPTVVESVGMEERARIEDALSAFESFDGDMTTVPSVPAMGSRPVAP